VIAPGTGYFLEQSPKPLDTNMVSACFDLMNKILKYPTEDSPYAVVQPGIHFNKDPSEKGSTVENGLCYQLESKGWAISNMGGISKQTVAGFLSNGCAGGSLKTSFTGSVLYGIRFVSADGTVHEVSAKDNNPDVYNATAISMGLFGLITQVTLKCIPRFDIIGSEITSGYDNCAQFDCSWAVGKDPDPKSTKPSIIDYFYSIQDGRIMWWPNPGLQKIVIWQARTMTQHDYQKPTFGKKDQKAPFKPLHDPLTEDDRVPYNEMGGKLIQLFADGLITLAQDTCMSTPSSEAGKWWREEMLKGYSALVSKYFVTDGVQNFRDWWYTGLPMDNNIDDYLMQPLFAEMWFPMETKDNKNNGMAVLKSLGDFFTKGGWAITGAFSVEIYCSLKQHAWLSPAYGTDVVRADLFWVPRGSGTFVNQPYKFYGQVWDYLDENKIQYRPHWGKYISKESRSVDLRNSYYPRMDAWKDLRTKFDPTGIFLPPYWKTCLKID